MLHIDKLEDGLPLTKALGSEVRIEIINLLRANKSMSMNELAKCLHITNGALTNHIKLLEACGDVGTSPEPSGHGNRKMCSLLLDKVLIDIAAPEVSEDAFHISLGVGQYTSCQVYPTCGMATPERIIGEVDDPRYFTHPDRVKADILWFTSGYVEYVLPNFLPQSYEISQITISAELGSEAPGSNSNWPSDISFYLNDIYIGCWTSPADYGDRPGLFTPDWWLPNWNQYGLLKQLSINGAGTYMDGLKISEVKIQDFHFTSHSTIKLRMGVDRHAAHVGGLIIYGENFGNYAQNIKVSSSYREIDERRSGKGSAGATPAV